MPTWVRNGTGTAPTSTGANLTASYALDNATAPGDFDPAGVTSVQIAYTITGASFSDDTWDDIRWARLFDGVSASGALINGTDATGLQNEGSNTDETDNSPNTGFNTTQWQNMALHPTAGSEFATYQAVKMNDSATLTMSALTVTITYTAGSTYDETGRAVVITSTTAMTDVQDYVDLLATTITSTIAMTDTYYPDVPITIVGTAQAGSNNNGGDVTLTFDGSPAEDDVVILFGGNGTTGAANPLGPSTGGYAEETSTVDLTNALSLGVWWKVMGATPDTTVVGQGSGSGTDATVYLCYVLRGVDTTTPMDAAAVTGSMTNTATPDPPSITTLTDKAWVIGAQARSGAATFSSHSSGYTNGVNAAGTDTNRFAASMASTQVDTAGAEDPGVITYSAAGDSYAVSIAVRPATDASTYDETGRATTITSTTAMTDVQDYVDLLLATTGNVTNTVTDVQSYVDLLATDIVSTIGLTDVQAYVDLLLSTDIASTIAMLDAQGWADLLLATNVISTMTSTDVQSYVDLLATTGNVTVNMTDVQDYVDLLLATAIASTITVTDVWSGDVGPTYDETGRAIVITSTQTILDILGFYELNLATDITSTVGLTDAQNYVETLLATTGSTTIGLTDAQGFADLLATTITSTVAGTDIQAYVDLLATTVVATVDITDLGTYITEVLATVIASIINMTDTYYPIGYVPPSSTRSISRGARTPMTGVRTGQRLIRS
jgi:hypothetical protein